MFGSSVQQQRCQDAAEHGATDAQIAPRQRVLQRAAQDYRDAEQQPVGLGGPGQALRQHVNTDERAGAP